MAEGSVTVRLQQAQDYQFDVHFGPGLAPLRADEPPPLGQGAGPTPVQLLAAAVGNCLSDSLLFALRKFKQRPEPIATEVTAEVGRNAEGRLRVLALRATITLGVPAEQLDHLDGHGLRIGRAGARRVLGGVLAGIKLHGVEQRYLGRWRRLRHRQPGDDARIGPVMEILAAFSQLPDRLMDDVAGGRRTRNHAQPITLGDRPVEPLAVWHLRSWGQGLQLGARLAPDEATLAVASVKRAQRRRSDGSPADQRGHAVLHRIGFRAARHGVGRRRERHGGTGRPGGGEVAGEGFVGWAHVPTGASCFRK